MCIRDSHMIFADIEDLREPVDGQVFREIFIDILENGADLGAILFCIQEFQPGPAGAPVQRDHELKEQKLAIESGGVSLVGKRLFQPVDGVEERLSLIHI